MKIYSLSKNYKYYNKRKSISHIITVLMETLLTFITNISFYWQI
jgi:hypothetical protein